MGLNQLTVDAWLKLGQVNMLMGAIFGAGAAILIEHKAIPWIAKKIVDRDQKKSKNEI